MADEHPPPCGAGDAYPGAPETHGSGREAATRLSIFTLLFTLVAACHIAIPTQAEAASALFRVKQSWSGLTDNGTGGGFQPSTYTSPDYHPRTMGPSKAPPATGSVSFDGDIIGFTLPSKVIKSYGTKTSFPFGINPPVVSSSVMNSYWNAKASFGPNNGPNKTIYIYPPTSTTTFNGNYDFSRSGRIMIIPGVNRFGGTLRMLAGAEVSGYKKLHILSIYYRQYGAGTLPFYIPTVSGVPLPSAYRYKMTVSSYNKETTGTPYSPGDYYVQKVMYIPSRSGQFTTEWVHVSSTTYWRYVSATGYDNRTSMGLKGNISMVRPRLVHSYVVPHDPNLPIRKERTFARIDRITVHFLPEPGVNAMLAAGLMGLVGLYRLRRR